MENKEIVHYTKLQFLPEYFSNENWHPSNMDMEWIGEDEMKKAIAEWQAEEDKVLFNDFRVEWDSSDIEYSHHETWPYELKHPFGKETTMEWEDSGFFVENDFGFIRFDRVKDITIGDFITACKLLRIPIENHIKSDLK